MTKIIYFAMQNNATRYPKREPTKMNKQARLGMGCGVSIVALLTAGCAAVVDGVHQPVSVTMRSSDGQDIADATCKL
ncbi:hypothetical protein [Burkholderia sp. 3C]